MRRTALFFAALLVAGCSSVDSADVRTHGMKAYFTVSVTEGAAAAEVSAGLNVGTLTFVDLDRGEKLTASAGAESTRLGKRNALGVTDYHGRLPGVTAAGTEVVVALTRTAENESAPKSVVRLAEPVTIASPPAGASFSRARNDIVVRLSSVPTDQPTEVSWGGECVLGGSVRASARNDTVRIAPGTIRRATPTSQATPAAKVPDVCTITLTVTRRVTGDLDPAFGGGWVAAEYRAIRQVSSQP